MSQQLSDEHCNNLLQYLYDLESWLLNQPADNSAEEKKLNDIRIATQGMKDSCVDVDHAQTNYLQLRKQNETSRCNTMLGSSPDRKDADMSH